LVDDPGRSKAADHVGLKTNISVQAQNLIDPERVPGLYRCARCSLFPIAEHDAAAAAA
jgi:hypothetical protein